MTLMAYRLINEFSIGLPGNEQSNVTWLLLLHKSNTFELNLLPIRLESGAVTRYVGFISGPSRLSRLSP